jgi:hypothetical protein
MGEVGLGKEGQTPFLCPPLPQWDKGGGASAFGATKGRLESERACFNIIKCEFNLFMIFIRIELILVLRKSTVLPLN